MRSIFAAALVAAATPLAAGAETCPTNADLETGIRLTRFDPFFSVVQTQTPVGLAEARVSQRGAAPESTSSLYEHPLTVTQRIGANGTLALLYTDDTTALNSLPSLREWSTTVSLVSDGETINQGAYSARIIGFGEAQIGACAYDVWRIDESLALDGSAPLRFEKSYAPDLGLVLSSIRLGPDGAPLNGVFFDEIVAE
ncbi:hypothetical protein L0666_08490 [Octadecabacter sp. CECT 8868]|uniref:hypothetical protein n=1 Tax=Octadecabacter algicola TaxID=2909342 RepID=UPI001F1C480C|nr:hypothetical protein [Octadecabacter algicola]MCF2905023.1 hypothetical protein [Octadecabacter algicola]